MGGNRMYYDLLVHVDLPEEQRFVMALNNMANYLAALAAQPCRIVLLANGGAVSHLVGGSVLADRIRELQTRGVSFRACANALRNASLTAENLLEGVEIVPAGVVEIVRLQREGFAYIKP